VQEQVSGEQMSYLRSASRHPCVGGRRRGRCLASNLSCRRQYRHIIRPPTDTGPGSSAAAQPPRGLVTVPPCRRKDASRSWWSALAKCRKSAHSMSLLAASTKPHSHHMNSTRVLNTCKPRERSHRTNWSSRTMRPSSSSYS